MEAKLFICSLYGAKKEKIFQKRSLYMPLLSLYGVKEEKVKKLSVLVSKMPFAGECCM